MATTLLRELFNKEPVTIEEAPFESALHEMCRVGMNASEEWILVCDGDLLVEEQALTRLIVETLDRAQPVHHAQGFILDRLSGSVRKGGPRLFRCSEMPILREFIPPPGTSPRPESAMVRAHPSDKGGSILLPYVVALHDYEQFYKDIYRKAFAHGQKHADWAGTCLPMWRDMFLVDCDFRIAARGFCDGVQSCDRLQTDIRKQAVDIKALLSEMNTDEKPPIDANALDSSWVTGVMNDSEMVRNWYKLRNAPSLTWRQRMLKRWQQIGTLRSLAWSCGSVLIRTGHTAQRFAVGPTPTHSANKNYLPEFRQYLQSPTHVD